MATANFNYNNQLRLYNAVFLAVFDDVFISRIKKFVKVPIEFVDKRKYATITKENPGNDYGNNITFPRMGFRLTDFVYAPERNLNKNMLIGGNGNQSMMRKPFDMSYDLHIRTKNMDDMYQIIEQIVIQFDPYLELDVLDNEDMKMDSNISLHLNNSGLDTLNVGSYDQEEILEATMTFTMRGYFYMPTGAGKQIKKIILNYHELDSGKKLGTDIITPEGTEHVD